MTLFTKRCGHCLRLARDLEPALIPWSYNWQCVDRDACRSRSLAWRSELKAAKQEQAYRAGDDDA